ncbi:DUF2637 domain-containing protein [Nonomuraea sp. NPDC049480]|uniref:DUF2637 domain-containing protein n=1 Tax=Nonomuraea sp. NPDC049480 TaxID=3364353 RepID=UPI0037A71A72
MNRNPTEPTGRPVEPVSGRPVAGLATRRVAIAVVSVIAAVAAYVSFRHQHGLAITAGEPTTTAWTLPVLIDGVIIMGSLVMLDASRRGDKAPWLARLALIAGAVATLAANVAHGWSGGLASSLISAVAPIVLVVAYELLMGMLRRTPRPAAESAPEPIEERTEDVPAVVVEASPPVPTSAEEAARAAYEASVRVHEPLSERKLADRFKLTRGQARTIIGEAVAAVVAELQRVQGSLPQADHIADRFGVTERRAAEIIGARLTEEAQEILAERPVEPVEETVDAEEIPAPRWGDRLAVASTDRPALTSVNGSGGAA